MEGKTQKTWIFTWCAEFAGSSVFDICIQRACYDRFRYGTGILDWWDASSNASNSTVGIIIVNPLVLHLGALQITGIGGFPRSQSNPQRPGRVLR
jgi:hypothetical protein